MRVRVILALLAVLSCASPAPAAPAQEGRSASEPLAAADVPESVAAQVQCGTDPDFVTRQPFAGGFVFAWKCPSNHANWITALVHADTAEGTNARLLRFPGPRPRAKPAEELSNVRWYPAAREVTELFVDPERRFCRTEARWRLTGKPPSARLIFWRETRDCDGKRGWGIVVDRRRK